jgi:hypothetical protein
LGPIDSTMRGESAASPGSSSTMFVSAQLRKPVSVRPACAAPRRTWPSASPTGVPRGGMANTRPSPNSPASSMARGPKPDTYSGIGGCRLVYLRSASSILTARVAPLNV